MKKILSIVLFALAASQAFAYDNWTSTNGEPVRNSTGQCWRDSSWTPATAHPDCDGALKPVVAKAPAAKVDITKPTAVIASAASTAPTATKTTLSTDTLFDFDKSVLKPAGKAALDGIVTKIQGINLEVVVAVGHTDSVGTDAYNLKLGTRRANAVKAYLVAKGVPANRVFTESKGESQPIADNKTAQGRAKNRRVEIEVVGTVKN